MEKCARSQCAPLCTANIYYLRNKKNVTMNKLITASRRLVIAIITTFNDGSTNLKSCTAKLL